MTLLLSIFRNLTVTSFLFASCLVTGQEGMSSLIKTAAKKVRDTDIQVETSTTGSPKTILQGAARWHKHRDKITINEGIDRLVNGLHLETLDKDNQPSERLLLKSGHVLHEGENADTKDDLIVDCFKVEGNTPRVEISFRSGNHRYTDYIVIDPHDYEM